MLAEFDDSSCVAGAASCAASSEVVSSIAANSIDGLGGSADAAAGLMIDSPDHPEVCGRWVSLIYFSIFAIFWRARSLLCQNEILQENMLFVLTAFLKVYKIRILLHRCNLKNLATNLFEKSAIS